MIIKNVHFSEKELRQIQETLTKQNSRISEAVSILVNITKKSDDVLTIGEFVLASGMIPIFTDIMYRNRLIIDKIETELHPE